MMMEALFQELNDAEKMDLVHGFANPAMRKIVQRHLEVFQDDLANIEESSYETLDEFMREHRRLKAAHSAWRSMERILEFVDERIAEIQRQNNVPIV